MGCNYGKTSTDESLSLTTYTCIWVATDEIVEDMRLPKLTTYTCIWVATAIYSSK